MKRLGTSGPERINRIGAPAHSSTSIFFLLVSALAFQAATATPQPPAQENWERILLLLIFTASSFLLSLCSQQR
jgi:hypothetical protein